MYKRQTEYGAFVDLGGIDGLLHITDMAWRRVRHRAERRHKQLISKGIAATLDSLRADLEARDARDASRTVAPLKPAEDAKLLDNSDLTVDQSVEIVLNWWQGKQPFKSV